jgi:hypothetical protein
MPLFQAPNNIYLKFKNRIGNFRIYGNVINYNNPFDNDIDSGMLINGRFRDTHERLQPLPIVKVRVGYQLYITDTDYNIIASRNLQTKDVEIHDTSFLKEILLRNESLLENFKIIHKFEDVSAKIRTYPNLATDLKLAAHIAAKLL